MTYRETKYNFYSFYVPPYTKACDVKRCNCPASSSCGINCENRKNRRECVIGYCSEKCTNNKIQRGVYPRTESRQTNSRGRGLCLYKDVKAGDFICEYVGEIIDDFELEVRILNTRADDFYHQQLKNGCWIDARNIGNVSRYINHSCSPNCEFQTWSVGNECRLVVVALKDMKEGVEITVDYNWLPIGNCVQKCNCNSDNCRKYIISPKYLPNIDKYYIWNSHEDNQRNFIPNENSVTIHNISYDSTPEELFQHLPNTQDISCYKVLKVDNKYMAVVIYKNRNSADSAITQLNYKKIRNRNVKVQISNFIDYADLYYGLHQKRMEKVAQYKRNNRLARFIDPTRSIEPLECLEAYNWKKMNIDKILEMMKKTPLLVEREKGKGKEEKEVTAVKEEDDNKEKDKPKIEEIKKEDDEKEIIKENNEEKKEKEELAKKDNDKKVEIKKEIETVKVKEEEEEEEVKKKKELINVIRITEKYKSKLPVIPTLPFQYEKLDTTLLSTLKINYDVNNKNINESLDKSLKMRTDSDGAKDMFYKVLLNNKSDMNKYIVTLCHYCESIASSNASGKANILKVLHLIMCDTKYENIKPMFEKYLPTIMNYLSFGTAELCSALSNTISRWNNKGIIDNKMVKDLNEAIATLEKYRIKDDVVGVTLNYPEMTVENIYPFTWTIYSIYPDTIIITFQLLTSLLLKVPFNRKTIVTAHILLSIYSPYIEISYIPYITIAIALLAAKLTDCPKSLRTLTQIFNDLDNTPSLFKIFIDEFKINYEKAKSTLTLPNGNNNNHNNRTTTTPVHPVFQKIIEYELELLKMFDFDINITYPHQFLQNLSSKWKITDSDRIKSMIKETTRILDFIMYLPVSVLIDHEVLCKCAMNIVSERKGIEIPFNDIDKFLIRCIKELANSPDKLINLANEKKYTDLKEEAEKLPEYSPLKSHKEIIDLYKLETKAIKENYDRMIKESINQSMLNNNNYTIATRYTPPTIPYRESRYNNSFVSSYQNRYSTPPQTSNRFPNNKTPRISHPLNEMQRSNSNNNNNNNSSSSSYYNKSRNYQSYNNSNSNTSTSSSSSLTNTPSKRHRYDSDGNDSYYHHSRDNKRSLSSHRHGGYHNGNDNSDNESYHSRNNHHHYERDYRNSGSRDSYKRSRSPNYDRNNNNSRSNDETPFKRSKSEKEDGEI